MSCRIHKFAFENYFIIVNSERKRTRPAKIGGQGVLYKPLAVGTVTCIWNPHWSKDKEGVQKFLCFRFGGNFFLNVRYTTQISGNREIPWRWKWRSPQNGFVERILTQQHCAHCLRKQAWVVNPGKGGNIPRPGWGKKDEKSNKGGRGANDRDRTCSKNWDTW